MTVDPVVTLDVLLAKNTAAAAISAASAQSSPADVSSTRDRQTVAR
jgi:hypothetical protein